MSPGDAEQAGVDAMEREQERKSRHIPTSLRDKSVSDDKALDRLIEDLGEDLAAKRDQLAHLPAEIRELEQHIKSLRCWGVPPSAKPEADRRMFGRDELDNPQPDPEPFRWSA